MKTYLRIILIFLFPAITLPAQPVFTLLSWNIRDFGASTDSAELRCIAEAVNGFEVVMIQEVTAGPGGAQRVADLAARLNRMGAGCDYAVSASTQSPGFRSERYAVLWKTARIRRRGQPALLGALSDCLDREPFLVRLEVDGYPLDLLNYHARAPNRQPEREAPCLAALLAEMKDRPLILAGDFNLSERHPAFVAFGRHGYRPALRDEPTSLVVRNGRLQRWRPLDNAFFNERYFTLNGAGALETAPLCGDAELAYDVSDHAPVWMIVRWVH